MFSPLRRPNSNGLPQRNPQPWMSAQPLEARDNPADIFAVASAHGTAASITVNNAATWQQTLTINPFDGFTNGVNVAVADVDGDGTQDVIAAPGEGGGPTLNIYSGAT